MKPKVLISFPIQASRMEGLKQYFDVHCLGDSNNRYEQVLDTIESFEGLLAVNLKVDEKLITAGKNLKIISNYGVGYDNVAIHSAIENDIVVTNTPKSTSRATAEYTMGLILDLSRKITLNDRRLRQKGRIDWDGKQTLGHSLYQKKLGILGMGRIGIEVARMANAFGMNVVYHNRKPLQDTNPNRHIALYVDKKTLFTKSDILSIHAPFTPETKDIVSSDWLKLMKPSSLLINTARGGLVNHDDLTVALASGIISGAALDVFPNEPEIPEALFQFEQVLLSPHNGTGTFEDRHNMFEEAVNNLNMFFTGNPNFSRVA